MTKHYQKRPEATLVVPMGGVKTAIAAGWLRISHCSAAGAKHN
jgi:hypothetical protein